MPISRALRSQLIDSLERSPLCLKPDGLADRIGLFFCVPTFPPKVGGRTPIARSDTTRANDDTIVEAALCPQCRRGNLSSLRSMRTYAIPSDWFQCDFCQALFTKPRESTLRLVTHRK